MKTVFVLIVIATLTMAGADKSADVATEVIRSEFYQRYTPRDASAAELDKAARIDAALRLQEIMLRRVDDQELRICYALRILEYQIRVNRGYLARSGNPDGYKKRLDVMLRQEEQLLKQFRDIRQ